jgi:hypothetical protein
MQQMSKVQFQQSFFQEHMMKVSLLGIGLALGLSAGIAAAQAAETIQVAVQPSPAAVATEQESYAAFKANINPTMTVKTTGGYDQEDLFVGRHGFPLDGWKEISNPPS